MKEEAVSRLTRDSEMQKRNAWFDPMRGGLPQIPNIDTLPTASAALAFRIVGLRHATDDKAYVCLKVASTWTWVLLT